MTILEPVIALTTCENALRELMGYVYCERYGAHWLEAVTTEKQREEWTKRSKAAQARTRRGAAEIDGPGLTYANFFDLLAIADKHWEELAPALYKKSGTYPLLDRFEQLRNDVAHGRTLLRFEQELYSGIAGQIRNQVTLYMSSRDDAGEYYPRIESVIDSFGHRLEGQGPPIVELFGGKVTTTILRPGERVQFTAIGTDPQDRPLRWDLATVGSPGDSKVSESGKPVVLEWLVQDKDVAEHTAAQIQMYVEGGKYRRFSRFDHRAYFAYIVRPPLDSSS